MASDSRMDSLHEIYEDVKPAKFSVASGSRMYSLPEFFKEMKPAKLDCAPKRPKDELSDWVFWSKENDKPLGGILVQGPPISERIKVALQEVRRNWWPWSLIQFWAPKKSGDRCFLSTSDQPFAIYKLRKKWGTYRKHCMREKIYIWEERENERLGPVGRAFRRGLPESSPDVRFYSLQEFPLRDKARRCLLSGLIVLPVFEMKEQICVGVLEFLGSPLNKYCLKDDILFFERQFKEVDLTLNHRYLHKDHKGWEYSLVELEEAVKVVVETYRLALALVFIPSKGCVEEKNCSDSGLLKLIACEKTPHEVSLDDFIEAHRAFLLQKGEGVVGKAFKSLKSCFCRNICDFSMTEYPLVHYARHAKLTLSFAINLHHKEPNHKDPHHKDHLIVEFFLLPSNDMYEDTRSLLESLLTKFKQHLHCYRTVSEDLLIEELFAKGIKSTNDYEADHLQISQDRRHPSRLQILQNDREMEQLDNTHQLVMLEGDPPNSGSHVVNAKEKDVAVAQAENRATKTKLKRKQPEGAKSRAISFEELKKHFGKPLDCAATHFGVSRSTIKRLCRDYGITRWPSHPKNQSSQYFFEMEMVKSGSHDGEASGSMFGGSLPCRDLSLPGNACNIGPVTSHGTSTEDARTVTIKASYGEGSMIRFELRFDSKLVQLEEEVTKRLKLQSGSFYMKYQDDENDWISITCDADLRNCVKTWTSCGKTTIKMSVHSNSN